jgi:hypothetical protein
MVRIAPDPRTKLRHCGGLPTTYSPRSLARCLRAMPAANRTALSPSDPRSTKTTMSASERSCAFATITRSFDNRSATDPPNAVSSRCSAAACAPQAPGTAQSPAHPQHVLDTRRRWIGSSFSRRTLLANRWRHSFRRPCPRRRDRSGASLIRFRSCTRVLPNRIAA